MGHRSMEPVEAWPIVLCVIQICLYFVLGFFLICIREFPRKELEGEHRAVKDFSVKVTENPEVLRQATWQAWGGALHPGWLLGLRLFAFFYLSGLFIGVYIQRGSWLYFFNYYTEWTLTILIIYFGWGAFVSIVEYTKNLRKHRGNSDPETGDIQAALLGEDGSEEEKAGYFGYTLQILFQIAGPAVVLTDGVYWSFLYPFFPEDFPHTFSEFNLHALNAVFLVAELFLNSMRFPWFRAAYFFIYSCVYVYFQWSIHVLGVVKRWPYPFMDVSSEYAPFWYLAIGILHITAFGIVAFLNGWKLIFLQDNNRHISSRARWWSLARSLWPGGIS